MTETLLNTLVVSNGLAGKQLPFTLDREYHRPDALKVRELIRRANLTAVPQMPEHLRGVMTPQPIIHLP